MLGTALGGQQYIVAAIAPGAAAAGRRQSTNVALRYRSGLPPGQTDRKALAFTGSCCFCLKVLQGAPAPPAGLVDRLTSRSIVRHCARGPTAHFRCICSRRCCCRKASAHTRNLPPGQTDRKAVALLGAAAHRGSRSGTSRATDWLHRLQGLPLQPRASAHQKHALRLWLAFVPVTLRMMLARLRVATWLMPDSIRSRTSNYSRGRCSCSFKACASIRSVCRSTCRSNVKV